MSAAGPGAGQARETSDDAFLGGRVVVRQPRRGHRTGHDGVLVAAAVPAVPGERVVEAGTGAGAAGLCLAARVPGVHVVGVEIDEGLAVLAGDNAARNGLGEEVHALCADVTAPARELAGAGLAAGSFDHAFANPPYLEPARARLSPDPGRARARALGPGGLAPWIGFLVNMLRRRGTLTLIHRPDSIPAILAGLNGRCGAIALRPVHARKGQAASRVIVQAVKGSRAPLSLLPGLILHRPDGSATGAAGKILRDGAALAMTPAG